MSDKFENARPWHTTAAPSLAEFEQLAANAYTRLPEQFRKLCEDLIIRVDDFPSAEVIDAMHLQSEFDLLGLFRGSDCRSSRPPCRN